MSFPNINTVKPVIFKNSRENGKIKNLQIPRKKGFFKEVKQNP